MNEIYADNVDRIKKLGTYTGPTDTASIIQDVLRVANTLITPYGGEYCCCQELPCVCVAKLLDDTAACLEARYPEVAQAIAAIGETSE